MGDEGLETVDLTLWCSNNFGKMAGAGAAESGAVGARSGPADLMLAEVIRRWDCLSAKARETVLRVVRGEG